MPRRGENIYRRKDGLWEARYTKGFDIDGKRKYGSVYAHSYREVKEKRQEIITKLQTFPKYTSVQKMKVKDLISEWLFVNRGRIKYATYQRYCTIYENHLKKILGDCCVCDLSPIQIRKFVDMKLEENLSPSSINCILTFLGTCIRYGNKQYGLPMLNIVFLRQPQREMRVLSPKEQNLLVELLLKDMDVYKLGVLVALYTGIRVGELCALKWSDIKDGKLYINKTMQRVSKGKGNGTELIIGETKSASSNRIIPLPSFLRTIIEKHRLMDEYYFLRTDKKDYAEPRVMQYRFGKYIKELGVPKANFHCLRHTFTSRSLEKGFELRSLSEILGHSNVNITLNRYAHSSLYLKAENMEKLSLFS